MSQTVKNLPAMQKTWVQSLGWEDPLEKEMATYHCILYLCIVSCLENPTGQRSLVGYRPWSHRESDTTKQLTLDKTIGCSVMGLLVKVGVG